MEWKNNLSLSHWSGIKEWYETDDGRVLIIAYPCWVQPIKSCLITCPQKIIVIGTNYDRKDLEWINEFRNH
jgi:hypothetical protein